MRAIGTLGSEKDARLFGDYLCAQGIRNDVDADGRGGWAVWVHDEDQMAEAMERMARFRARRDDAEFRRVAAGADEVRAAEQEENERWRKKYHSRRKLAGNFSIPSPGVVTWALLAVCLLLGFYSQLGRKHSVMERLKIESRAAQVFQKEPLAEVRSGEVWRLWTPALLHGGLLHLVFNMMMLMQLGALIESRAGPRLLLLQFVLMALVSNLAQWLVSGPNFVGLSGVIYGWFGYAWMRGKYDPSSGLTLNKQAVISMLAWFFICFSGLLPIANTAHASGLVMGMAWGRLAAWRGR